MRFQLDKGQQLLFIFLLGGPVEIFMTKLCGASCFRSVVIVLMFWWCLPSIASDTQEEYDELEMYGERYPNACSSSQKSGLRNAILTASMNGASTVWRAVNAILCARRTGSEKIYLAGLFAEEVTEEIESTGDESSFRRIRRNTGLVNSVMAAGKAWNAEVHIDRDKIDLQYFANETCVKRVTLSYRRGKWVVDGIGEACD